MAKRERRERTLEAKSRLVYTNGGFVLKIERSVWPKWLQDEPRVRITEIVPKAKKAAKRKGKRGN